MATLVRKARQFKKAFTKEERLVIVLGAIVTLFTIVFGLVGLLYLVKKVLDWYVELTAPYVINALNAIVGALFEGWTLL